MMMTPCVYVPGWLSTTAAVVIAVMVMTLTTVHAPPHDPGVEMAHLVGNALGEQIADRRRRAATSVTNIGSPSVWATRRSRGASPHSPDAAPVHFRCWAVPNGRSLSSDHDPRPFHERCVRVSAVRADDVHRHRHHDRAANRTQHREVVGRVCDSVAGHVSHGVGGRTNRAAFGDQNHGTRNASSEHATQ